MVYDLNLIEPMQKVRTKITRFLLTDISHKYRMANNIIIHTILLIIITIIISIFDLFSNDNIFSLLQLFQLHTEGDNQLHQLRNDVIVTPDDLLSMPAVSH